MYNEVSSICKLNVDYTGLSVTVITDDPLFVQVYISYYVSHLEISLFNTKYITFVSR